MPRRRPNILLLLTDQQRFDTIAALGNATIRTPALDRLARAGMSFERAYTPCPVCVASRCALLTGMPPHVTGCVDNAGMPRHAPSLMSRLAERGYQTHGVGKMHFTPDPRRLWGFESRDSSEEIAEGEDDYRDWLRARGFGHVTEPHGLRSEYYYIPQPAQLPPQLHHTTWATDRAIDFVQRRDATRPFFLMLSYIKPHPPFESPTPWSHLYRAAGMPGPTTHADQELTWTYWNRVQNRYKYADAGTDRRLAQLRQAAYYGCISFIDHQIGRLFEAMGPLMDDTLILFTSDHGELLGDYGCVGKRSMHEAAARVPLIAYQRSRLCGGRRVSRPVSLLDVLPTSLAAAGDDQPQVHPDGDDLYAIATERSDRRYTFSQYQQGRYALYMATNGRHKLVYSAADRREWLYRVSDERGQQTEVLLDPYHTEPGIQSRLRRLMHERFARDGYVAAADDAGWVEYTPPQFPQDPDRGLLYQDSQELIDAVQALPAGYRFDPPPGWDRPYELMATPEPFKRPADQPQAAPLVPHIERVSANPAVLTHRK